MRASEGSPRDITVHGDPESFPVQIFEMLQRLGFAALDKFESGDLASLGGLPGLTGILLVPAWWVRYINFGVISRRQNTDIHTRLLENDRPGEREKRPVDPLTVGCSVEGIDESLEAGNVRS